MPDFLRFLRRGGRPLAAALVALALVGGVVLVGRNAGRPAAKPAPAKPSPVPAASEPARPAVEPATSPPAKAQRQTAPRAGPRRPRSAGCGVPVDYNGDGFADLAIGIPGEDLRDSSEEAEIRNAGAVQVLYGSAAGLTARANQLLTQDSPGVADRAEAGDGFGQAIASGDFDGDGYDDMAVGAPDEDVNNLEDGGVTIIFGSSRGLTGSGSEFWSQDSPGIDEIAATHDGFGTALAAGDFNADGYADLAVGVPFEDLRRVGYLSANGSAGIVQVLLGSAAGLTAKGSHIVSQDSDGVPDDVEGNDLFGWSVVAGNFDGDRFCDVAVGVPAERVGDVAEAGAVNILRGSPTGLTGAGSQFWTQDSPGIGDQAEVRDQFGYDLTAGDFNGDGKTDLAVGVLDEDVGDRLDAGAVSVLYGAESGLAARGNQVWTQDSPGVADTSEQSDEFGRAIVAGNFDGDRFSDLAIGVPYETLDGLLGSVDGAGAVEVLYGSSRGLASARSQLWTQDSPDVADTAESTDLFGFALGAADFDRDGAADLAIGVLREAIDAQTNAGALNVLYGTRGGGLAAARNQFWRQGAGGLPDTPEPDDSFGAPLD